MGVTLGGVVELCILFFRFRLRSSRRGLGGMRFDFEPMLIELGIRAVELIEFDIELNGVVWWSPARTSKPHIKMRNL